MTFSATDAAFEGFRVVRRHPLAILFWGLAYLIFFGALFGVFGGTLATMLATAESLEGAQPSPQDLEALGWTYMNFMGLMLPLALVLSAVLNAAVSRAVLRPEEKAFGYLRLGGDELRVLAVTVILAIVFFAVSMAVFAVVFLAAGLMAQVNQGLAILVAVVMGLGAAAVLIWLSIRLSLAVPVTVAEKRIAPFASFAMTKGHSLSLLGMGVIAFIMSMLVSLLGGIVSLPVTMAMGGMQDLATMDGQSTAQILRAAGPMLLANGVIQAILSALQVAVIYAPFAAAYRDLKGLPHE